MPRYRLVIYLNVRLLRRQTPNSFRRLPPCFERLEGISLPRCAHLESLALSVRLGSALLPERHEANLVCDGLLSVLGQQVLGDVLQVRLLSGCPELTVVAEMAQFRRVLFKVSVNCDDKRQLSHFLNGRVCR